MKMPAMLKRQQFEDNKSDKTVLRVEKCQHLNKHDDKEWQSLDKYEGECEGEANRYILLPFNIFLLPL